MPNKQHTLILAISMIINATLMFILLVKFHTSPADVLRELQKTELKISMKLAAAQATEERVLLVLDERKRWMIELTKELKKGFEDGALTLPTPPQ